MSILPIKLGNSNFFYSMKVAELRTILGKQSKAEIIKVAVELYKRVPKAKKEEYDIDNLIQNPKQAKAKTVKKQAATLIELETEIHTFIEHVRLEYYYVSNKVVPKAERSKWRFKVKRYYKELNNFNRRDRNISLQADLLTALYQLLSEACEYAHFNTFDPFRSISVDSQDFYATVLRFLYESKSETDFIKTAIRLALGPSDGNILKQSLYNVFIKELKNNEDLQVLALHRTKHLLNQHGYTPPTEGKRFDSDEYSKNRKHNHLVDLIFRLYASMDKYEEAIAFFQKEYHRGGGGRSKEIKLYILVSTLFELNQAEHILTQIEQAKKEGIQPRENLLNLATHIRTKGTLPKYMR